MQAIKYNAAHNTLDDIIKLLLDFNKADPKRLDLSPVLLELLSQKAHSVFAKEPTLLRLDGSYHIFGDIHGQYGDMLRFLEITGLPPKTKLIFLGDYVDRGDYSIEVIALLFALKLKWPKHVYLIRGNHECAEINKEYGFFDECNERFGAEQGLKMWKTINSALHMLPVCILLNEIVFCVHGGISPEIQSLSDIEKLPRGACIPDSGGLCDLTWSDPIKRQKDAWKANDRGVSYTFNERALTVFLERNNLQLLCRAHQVVKGGYEFFHGRLITVFSAPNYCGDSGNLGAVMFMNDMCEFSFIILKPTARSKARRM